MKSSRRRDVDLTVISRNLSAVARLMGYTPNGLRDLIGSQIDWVLIGTTRVEKSRVFARCCGVNSFEFTSNQLVANGFAMPEDVELANKVRREISDAIVSRVKSSRDASVNSIVRHANRNPQIESANCDAAIDKIIYPVAPRDPRGF